MTYKARVTVSLQEGVTDPEGKATLNSLKNLGFEVGEVKKSSLYEISNIKAKDVKEAKSKVDEMCKRLLSNTSKDVYSIVVEEM